MIKSITEDMTSRIIEMGEVIGTLTSTGIAYETIIDKLGALSSRNVTKRNLDTIDLGTPHLGLAIQCRQRRT